MKERPTKELVREIHQAVFGVKGTEDQGFVGDLKEVKQDVKAQNGRYRKLSTKVNILWGIAIAAGGASGYSISQLLG